MSQYKMSLLQLTSALNNNPQLATALNYDAVVNYIGLIRCLKPSIALQQASYHRDPPDSLTVSIHEFLKVCLDISDDTAKLAWAVSRNLAWAFEGTDEDIDALQHKYIKLFMEHGLSRGISMSKPFSVYTLLLTVHVGLFNITPPTRVCIDPTCWSTTSGQHGRAQSTRTKRTQESSNQCVHTCIWSSTWLHDISLLSP